MRGSRPPRPPLENENLLNLHSNIFTIMPRTLSPGKHIYSLEPPPPEKKNVLDPRVYISYYAMVFTVGLPGP